MSTNDNELYAAMEKLNDIHRGIIVEAHAVVNIKEEIERKEADLLYRKQTLEGLQTLEKEALAKLKSVISGDNNEHS